VRLQVKLSYAATEDEALEGAFGQWKTNILAAPISEELRTPEQFAAAARHVRPEDMREHVRISADVEQQLAWLREDLALGVDQLYLHNVNRGQARFIDDFGAQVLPALRDGS
jgi:alkanesulfonate monooxygenase SsuD/methylene tetrahydromethanopterin reductase-like flavin-dependent oxidoreductase (luciferase family)